MAMSGTSTTSMSSQIQTYYDRLFLHRAKPELRLVQFADTRGIPKNNGDGVFFNKYKTLSAATTALTEGVVPTANELTTTRISAALVEYGDWTKISTLVSLVAIDPNLSHKVELFGDQLALTRDTLLQNELAPNATAQVAGTSTAISEMTVISTHLVTATQLRKAKRTLKVNKAPALAGGMFAAIVSPEVAYDWTGDSDFVNASRYADSTQLFQGELGRWMGIRIVEASTVYRTDLSATQSATGVVFSTLVFGAHAFATIPINGGGIGASPSIMVKTPGANSTDQPINRFTTVGWGGTWTQKLLDANYIINIKSRATDQS